MTTVRELAGYFARTLLKEAARKLDSYSARVHEYADNLGKEKQKPEPEPAEDHGPGPVPVLTPEALEMVHVDRHKPPKEPEPLVGSLAWRQKQAMR